MSLNCGQACKDCLYTDRHVVIPTSLLWQWETNCGLSGEVLSAKKVATDGFVCPSALDPPLDPESTKEKENFSPHHLEVSPSTTELAFFIKKILSPANSVLWYRATISEYLVCYGNCLMQKGPPSHPFDFYGCHGTRITMRFIVFHHPSLKAPCLESHCSLHRSRELGIRRGYLLHCACW